MVCVWCGLSRDLNNAEEEQEKERRKKREKKKILWYLPVRISRDEITVRRRNCSQPTNQEGTVQTRFVPQRKEQ